MKKSNIHCPILYKVTSEITDQFNKLEIERLQKEKESLILKYTKIKEINRRQNIKLEQLNELIKNMIMEIDIVFSLLKKISSNDITIKIREILLEAIKDERWN